MASEGMRAHGTLLKVSDMDATSPTFTTVAEVTNISGPSLSRETFDLTSHSSTGGYREFGIGLIDAGEVTLDINYVPSNATHDNSTGLLSLISQSSNDSTDFELVFPDTDETTWSFSGFVTAFSPTAPVGDLLGASVTVKVTGAPTLA